MINKENREVINARSRKYRAKNPEKYRAYMRAYLKVWSQKKKEAIAGRDKPDKCDICGNAKSKKICFDHDHKTGKFRGWLCLECNVVLGLIGDSVERLEMLIVYLKNNSQS